MYIDNSSYIRFLEDRINKLESLLERYEGKKVGKYHEIPLPDKHFPKDYILREKAHLEFEPRHDGFCRDAIVLYWGHYKSVLYMDSENKYNIDAMRELYSGFFYRLMDEYQRGKTRCDTET